MNHGTERNRKRWEAMTPDQRAAVEKVRAGHATPEYREQEERPGRRSGPSSRPGGPTPS